MMSYDPNQAVFPSFAAARLNFERGESPRSFLETCLEAVEEREQVVRAFVSLDVQSARRAADAASQRWRANRQFSPLDGMPVGIKDCFDVAGLPTRVNSPLFDDAQAARFDAAHVYALRRGGAVVLGKTVTTELTMALPGPTTNPWDPARTPGGSSSGSAAAVAAGMLPLATGSQVRGSVIRPASICGIPGFKPTFGALNSFGGFDPTPSLNHLGFLGATFEDIWDAACLVAQFAGPDPGQTPLAPSPYPSPRRPLRLARQYTIGWEKTDEASKAIFENWLDGLRASGTEILEPQSCDELAAYEDATARTQEFFFGLFREMNWILSPAREAQPDAFSHVVHRHIDNAARLTLADYQGALQRQRDLKRMHRALSGKVDGFVTLAHIGAGQMGFPDVGTPWYNDASSAVGAPTVNLPLLSVEGLPLGVQLMGFEHEDRDLIAMARELVPPGARLLG